MIEIFTKIETYTQLVLYIFILGVFAIASRTIAAKLPSRGIMKVFKALLTMFFGLGVLVIVCSPFILFMCSIIASMYVRSLGSTYLFGSPDLNTVVYLLFFCTGILSNRIIFNFPWEELKQTKPLVYAIVQFINGVYLWFIICFSFLMILTNCQAIKS